MLTNDKVFMNDHHPRSDNRLTEIRIPTYYKWARWSTSRIGYAQTGANISGAHANTRTRNALAGRTWTRNARLAPPRWSLGGAKMVQKGPQALPTIISILCALLLNRQPLCFAAATKDMASPNLCGIHGLGRP